MTYLKEAVDKQRSLLIKKLIRAGMVDPSDTKIYDQSIAELENEYKRSLSDYTRRLG